MPALVSNDLLGYVSGSIARKKCLLELLSMLVPAPLVLLEAKAAKVKILNKLIRDNNRIYIYFDQSESRHLLLYYNKGSTLNFCFLKQIGILDFNSNVILGT